MEERGSIQEHIRKSNLGVLNNPPIYLTILPTLLFTFNYICYFMITTHLVIWQAEKENRENKSFGSMCIDDNITRIKYVVVGN